MFVLLRGDEQQRTQVSTSSALSKQLRAKASELRTPRRGRIALRRIKKLLHVSACLLDLNSFFPFEVSRRYVFH